MACEAVVALDLTGAFVRLALVVCGALDVAAVLVFVVRAAVFGAVVVRVDRDVVAFFWVTFVGLVLVVVDFDVVLRVDFFRVVVDSVVLDLAAVRLAGVDFLVAI